MQDNSAHQDGTSNSQAVAHGKRSRSKIVINNSAAASFDPKISYESRRRIPGSSRTYGWIASASSIATILGFFLAVSTYVNESKVASIIPAQLTPIVIWAGLGVVCALIAAFSFVVLGMMRKQLLGLAAVHGLPVILGQRDGLHVGALTGTCPVDGNKLLFRNGPRGSGPVATCWADRRHTYPFSPALQRDA